MYETLKKLAEKKALNKEDKDFIIECCTKMGLTFNPKKGCKNCYFDQIFKITSQIRKEQTTPNKGCEYLLKPELKINVIHRGVHINADNLTNEKAEMLIKDGLLRWFAKYPEKWATKTEIIKKNVIINK